MRRVDGTLSFDIAAGGDWADASKAAYSYLIIDRRYRTQWLVADLTAASQALGIIAIDILIAIEEEGIYDNGTLVVVDFVSPSHSLWDDCDASRHPPPS